MSGPTRTHKEISPEGTAADVSSLIAVLGSKDVLMRQTARERLTEIGLPAVKALTRALKVRTHAVRWEAAKALGEIADASAAPALVDALEDDDAGVRWLAAEGLIAIGREGVPPLLNALIERSDSQWLREGAHHVLREFVGYRWGKGLARVVESLEAIVPSLAVPVAARDALEGGR